MAETAETIEKLFYEDSHMSAFTAHVVSCEWDEKKESYAVVLDRTAFFPEGGGQYADSGKINGMEVVDVKEKNDVVFHYMKQSIEPGTEVKGEIDFEERFSKMQQHTGEHIVSGLVHRHFGYDNVGFHLGKELVTMDFNGMLDAEDLRKVELEANQAVAENIEIVVTYPTKEELAEMDYRSKKEIAGQVRIVTVPGYDVCACCAPHVAKTGEIGLIKLVDAVKYKGGMRVTMVCGFRALQDYQKKEDSVREISRLLSAKPDELADAVRRLQAESLSWKDKVMRMQNRYMEQKLAEIPEGAENCILFEEEMDKNAGRKFVDSGMRKCSGICALFLGNEEKGYQYTLGSQSINLKEFMKEFHSVFPGKGGGKPEMVQGTVQPGDQLSEEAIRLYLCKK